MDRQLALAEVEKRVDNKNLVKHMLATEAVMKGLAGYFGENQDEWAMAGLIHDIDLGELKDDMSLHSKRSAEIAASLGAGKAVCQAILVHNSVHGIIPDSRMEKALFCADPITGLITAAALVRPDKKLACVEAKSVAKRFKEKSFAAGANREQIASCSSLGLELDEFIRLSLSAMQSVSSDLGL
jgi:predicted hydrolase (HD superfamily)